MSAHEVVLKCSWPGCGRSASIHVVMGTEPALGDYWGTSYCSVEHLVLDVEDRGRTLPGAF